MIIQAKSFRSKRTFGSYLFDDDKETKVTFADNRITNLKRVVEEIS